MIMKRREFIKYTAAAAGSIALSSYGALQAAEVQKKYAHDQVSLGRTGINVSRLAMGTGTNGYNHQSNQTRAMGIEGLAGLLKSAFDQGINFWDSADQYGSHPHLKEALKYVPRDKVVILTKTHAESAEEMKEDLDRFRKEIGTDYIDIILLHMMIHEDWPDQYQGAMEELSRAREQGIIRAHGVSCHSLDALKTASHSDWVQVDLARINPRGAYMDAEVETVANILEFMHHQGKGVIGMKILGAGTLRNEVNDCLRYVLNMDCVDAFTIGQENKEQMMDLINRIPDASRE